MWDGQWRKKYTSNGLFCYLLLHNTLILTMLRKNTDRMAKVDWPQHLSKLSRFQLESNNGTRNNHAKMLYLHVGRYYAECSITSDLCHAYSSS